jgi:hypothetical protein
MTVLLDSAISKDIESCIYYPGTHLLVCLPSLFLMKIHFFVGRHSLVSISFFILKLKKLHLQQQLNTHNCLVMSVFKIESIRGMKYRPLRFTPWSLTFPLNAFSSYEHFLFLYFEFFLVNLESFHGLLESTLISSCIICDLFKFTHQFGKIWLEMNPKLKHFIYFLFFRPCSRLPKAALLTITTTIIWQLAF